MNKFVDIRILFRAYPCNIVKQSDLLVSSPSVPQLKKDRELKNHKSQRGREKAVTLSRALSLNPKAPPLLALLI